MFVHICNFFWALFSHPWRITWGLACNILDYLNICNSEYLACLLKFFYHRFFFLVLSVCFLPFGKVLQERHKFCLPLIYSHTHSTCHLTHNWRSKSNQRMGESFITCINFKALNFIVLKEFWMLLENAYSVVYLFICERKQIGQIEVPFGPYSWKISGDSLVKKVILYSLMNA